MKACNFQTVAKLFIRYLCAVSEEAILHILLSDVKRQMDSLYRSAISGLRLMQILRAIKRRHNEKWKNLCPKIYSQQRRWLKF